MLSICIPVYNINLEKLALTLNEQCFSLGIPIEILIADDCSLTEYNTVNKKIAEDIDARYLSLPVNIGRSAIRNLLCREARYENLLFLDCDSLLCIDRFIENYLPFCNKNSVVYGGRIYTKEGPDSKYRLHWKYGNQRESKPVDVRKSFPTKYFSTNNFLISKSILAGIRFNEKLSGYGHEDTLFAMELYQNDILVIHFENPVIHGGLEDNDSFLSKAEAGVANLAKIFEIFPDKLVLRSHVTLIATYFKIERSKVKWLFMTFFSITKPLMKALIKYTHILKVLDLYKLGLFCYYLDKNKKAPSQ